MRDGGGWRREGWREGTFRGRGLGGWFGGIDAMTLKVDRFRSESSNGMRSRRTRTTRNGSEQVAMEGGFGLRIRE